MAGAEHGYDIHLMGLGQEAYDMIQKIKEMSGAASEEEAIFEAIALYNWFLLRKAAGKKLYRLEGGVPVPLNFEFKKPRRLRSV